VTSPAFTPGTTLVNPFNRETFIFTKPENPEVAEFEARLGSGGSGGGNALPHIHPKADEEFTVRSGRLHVCVAGVDHALGPGQTMVVPQGTSHFFTNAHEGDTELVIRFTPGQNHLRFFHASRRRPRRIRNGSGPKGSRSFSAWRWLCTRTGITCTWRGRPSGCRRSCLRRFRLSLVW
jgi:mannose-6-phosphate isomerase-like protein (cupin superfamily)